MIKKVKTEKGKERDERDSRICADYRKMRRTSNQNGDIIRGLAAFHQVSPGTVRNALKAKGLC